MQTQININIAVDVVKALSEKTLEDNMYMMDNSAFGSVHQGTEKLRTECQPGQTIHWIVYAIDLQTPVTIKNITFISSDGEPQAENTESNNYSYTDNPDLKTWTGILPYMVCGKEYRYRLELQMGEGKNSIMSIETPSLVWNGVYAE